jgi:tetratricopeptide (TPR) repeat protein
MNKALYPALAVAALACLVPITLDSCSSLSMEGARDTMVSQHLARADLNFADGRTRIAEAGYTAALKLNPLHPRARRGLERVQAQRLASQNNTLDANGAFALALRFEAAIETDPKHGPTYRLALGKIYSAMGDGDAAEKWFGTAVESDPTNARAWRLQGALLSQRGKLDEAVKSLEKSAELDPKDGQTSLLLGVIYKQQKKMGQAVTALTKASEAFPTAKSWFELGDALLQSNEPEKAYQALRQAARAPGAKALSGSIAATSGVAAYRTKRYPEAVNWLQQASKDSKSPAVHLNLAVALQAVGNHAQAIPLLQALVRQQPLNVDTTIQLMVSLARTDKADAARQVGDRFLATAGNQPQLAASVDRMRKIMTELSPNPARPAAPPTKAPPGEPPMLIE